MGTISSTGYTRATQQEIKDAIFTAWRSRNPLGATFSSSPDAPQTAIAETVAESFAALEELVAACFAGASRSNAIGQQLDWLGEILGVPRKAATRSTVTATVNLDPGVTLPIGTQAADSTDSNEIYRTTEVVTNGTGAAANFSVAMEAVEAGTGTFVATGQLTVIVNPVTGWNSVTNASDSTLGTDLETDAAYRLRQVNVLNNAGTGTKDAIKSAVLSVAGVTQAEVPDNVGLTISGLGIPGKAFEVIAEGGADNDIAQAIWDNKPIGIEAHGSTSGTATDDSGTSQTVAFSRPTSVPIYVDITLTTDSNYPGDTEFKEAFVTAATAFFTLGKDVVWSRLYDLAFSVAGVVDVTLLEVGLSSFPSGTSNLPITIREFADFDTSRVVIV